MMPVEYIGVTTKSGGYTTNQPRQWTPEEIAFAENLVQQGYTVKQVAHAIYRDSLQVQIKLKRLKKKSGEYNDVHREDKYACNRKFLEMVNPKSVLDVYSGAVSFYSQYPVHLVTNDANKDFNTDYNEDSFDLMCRMWLERRPFDLIDLDPFGSAYDCLDIAVRLAKKALVVTFGEYGHRRFKRTDYVKTRYGIASMDDFTLANMISRVQEIGYMNKKTLTPVIVREWRHIARVYFVVGKHLVTEQWSTGKADTTARCPNNVELRNALTERILHGK